MREISIGKAMKEKEIFERIRKKGNKMTLHLSFMIMVSSVMLGSCIIALALALLAQWLFPAIKDIPLTIELIMLGIVIAFFVSWILAKRFFKPIDELRAAMQKVADGNFDVRIENKSAAKEFQEVVAGFNMMVQELRSTEIIQGDFVSNVSHEFKTPINAIEGYATLLQSAESIDDAEAEYIDKILFNTKRISSLVNNVLLLSKIENQSLQLHKEAFDIAEQIREEIVAAEPAWSRKNLEFDVELEDTGYCGYKNLMHHVWSNLIENAIKFSPRQGEISIKLQKTHDSLILTIRDRGPGISDEAKKHIFDKFYQADTSHKGDGNGLGLALVKRILGVCGGEIAAENAEGGGCRFTVTLAITN